MRSKTRTESNLNNLHVCIILFKSGLVQEAKKSLWWFWSKLLLSRQSLSWGRSFEFVKVDKLKITKFSDYFILFQSLKLFKNKSHSNLTIFFCDYLKSSSHWSKSLSTQKCLRICWVVNTKFNCYAKHLFILLFWRKKALQKALKK